MADKFSNYVTNTDVKALALFRCGHYLCRMVTGPM
jgi:hypothetical protein